MDKTEIIKVLNGFPYAREDYWVITGGAMVLYGIKEQTSDIDLGCNQKLADALERDGCLCGHSESGSRRFKYGEHIEVFENWLNDSVTSAGGFQVITLTGLIEMKQALGREKDLRDILLITEYLKGEEKKPDDH